MTTIKIEATEKRLRNVRYWLSTLKDELSLSDIVKAAPKKTKNGHKSYKFYFNCGKGCLQYFTMFTFSFF